MPEYCTSQREILNSVISVSNNISMPNNLFTIHNNYAVALPNTPNNIFCSIEMSNLPFETNIFLKYSSFIGKLSLSVAVMLRTMHNYRKHTESRLILL